MEKKTHTGLQISGTTTQLDQEISHLCIAQSTEDTTIYQVFDDQLREGNQITLYVGEPAGSVRSRICQCQCPTHDDNPPDLFTVDVRELIVDRRIGHCRGYLTQQAWPILLASSIQLISASDTTTGRGPTDSNHTDTTAWNHRQQLYERPDTNHLSPHQTQTEIQIGGRQ